MGIIWFPLLWWQEEGHTIIIAETDMGERIRLTITGQSSMQLDMRKWYACNVDREMRSPGLMLYPSRKEAARILYVTSISNIYGVPISIYASHGTSTYEWNEEPVMHLLDLWNKYRPHLLVMDRHEEYVHIVRYTLLQWALDRLASPLPHYVSTSKMWHKLHPDKNGNISLHSYELTYVPRECAYLPLDQWIWADEDHRSILMHYVYGYNEEISNIPIITRHIPSWHKIRKDYALGYRSEYIFDIGMYACTMIEGETYKNLSLEERCNILQRVSIPQSYIKFMKPESKMSIDSSILRLCNNLYRRYKEWIGDRWYLFYCHVLNGTHYLASLIQMMPIMRSKKENTELGIRQRRRMSILLDMMSMGELINGIYIIPIDSKKILSFCRFFKKESTRDNMLSILHEEFLIDGASYDNEKFFIPEDNIVAW